MVMVELTKSWDSGKDVNIPVHNCNWDPKLLMREDELLLQVTGLVRRELSHAELSFQGGRVDIPVELGLRWVRFGHRLHLRKCFLV